MKNIEVTILKRRHFHSYLSIATAMLFTILLVAQLFRYETMATSLQVMMPTVLGRSAATIAALTVTLELFSVAYFLPIYLSRLARVVSVVAAFAVLSLWAWFTASALTQHQASPAALIGSIGDLQNSVLQLFIIIGLFVATVVVTCLDSSVMRGTRRA